ncbi:MAG: hypothetical protein IIX13_09420 [Bacteroidales bacterium]|nr:hypothetical protein [Bacteroidales bacterium]
MKEIETLKKTILTQQDIDVLASIAIVCVHVAERVINAIAHSVENEYHKKPQYDAACRKYGRAVVNERVKELAIEFARGDERFAMGKTLKELQKALKAVEGITAKGISPECCRLAANELVAYDALQSDVNLYGKLFALIANCDNDDDIIKIESTVKMFATKWKKDRASDRVFEVFNANI